jgi:phosphoserine phosphatase RsbU/P
MMRQSYLKFRAQMLTAGYWPQGWVARGAYYSLGFAIFLFAVQMLLALVAPSWSDSLGGWIKFLLFDAALLFCIVAFRTLRKKVLWRLRNRLIVTYVFIGVIPVVLLVVMAMITMYLFAGQFASFVVTSEINSQLRSMQAANAAVSSELAGRIEKGEAPNAASIAGLKKRDRSWGRRRVCAWHGARLLTLDSSVQSDSVSYPDFFNKEDNEYAKAVQQGLPFKEIVRDKGELYLRATSAFMVGSDKLMVVTSEPLDQDLVAEIAASLGEITLYAAGIGPDDNGSDQKRSALTGPKSRVTVSVGTDKQKKGIVFSDAKPGVPTVREEETLHPIFSVGSVAAPTGIMDREISFGTPLPVVDWKTGQRERVGALGVSVHTRPSVLYGHLFAALGDIARGVEYLLLAILIIFGVIELVALIIGARMTKTVTGAVAQLDEATRHVDRGDFSHRIPVKSADQLAQLSLSFNSMTESIEKLILEQKEKQRLEGELAIAQEVQAQLFPKEISQLESLEVHGFCRPARTVSGDYYDFLTLNSGKMIFAVGDISGKGISSALMMATIHSAVRAYSIEGIPLLRELETPEAVLARQCDPSSLSPTTGLTTGLMTGRSLAISDTAGAEVSPAVLLGLLNHQLYDSTPDSKYATLFLGIYDAATRRLTYSNGGHLPPILLSEDGSTSLLDCGGSVVGLLDNMDYREATVQLRRGDVLIGYTDGVTEPESDYGEFGEERLIQIVQENRHLPLTRITEIVTAAVDDWIGDNEQPDDVTLVLARAR